MALEGVPEIKAEFASVVERCCPDIRGTSGTNPFHFAEEELP